MQELFIGFFGDYWFSKIVLQNRYLVMQNGTPNTKVLYNMFLHIYIYMYIYCSKLQMLFSGISQKMIIKISYYIMYTYM